MKRKARIFWISVACFPALCWAAWSVSISRSDGHLTVAFLDVGQGDAVYIESPSGVRALYDAGPDGAVVRSIRPFLPVFSRRIDLAILSHPDQDHVAGFSDVLRRYSIAAIVDSGYRGEVDNPFYGDILSQAASRGIPVVEARSGDRIDLGEGAFAEVFAPDGAYLVGDANISSIALRISYGSTSLMLTGDLPVSHEEVLVDRYGARLDADVFKAGHHGSRTSSGESFLDAVTPEFIVVSSGKGNSYGHPDPEVTGRFDRKGIRWANTAASGTIVLRSDGTQWTVR